MSQVSSSLGLVGMGAVLLSCSSVAWALGVGQIKSNSVLGDRLDVTIAVLGRPDEKTPLQMDCIKPVVEVGERPLSPQQFRIQLHPGRDGALYMIQLVSEVSIIEPVVSVSITLGCESSLTRQFMLLMDPPGFIANASRLEGANGGSASSAAVTDSQSETSDLMSASSSASTPARRRSSSRSGGELLLKPQRPRVSSGLEAKGASPAPAKLGARLSLEAPDLSAVTPLRSTVDAAQGQSIAKQIGLLGELENLLKQLGAENQSVGAGMDALKGQLTAAEFERQVQRARHFEQPPMVWIVGGVMGLMILGLLGFWLRQRRQPRRQLPDVSIFHPNAVADSHNPRGRQ